MFVSVFVRRLREAKTYDDFKAAWYPDQGFGVPTRVHSGVRLDDSREIVSIGFVDAPGADLAALGVQIGAAEAKRRDAIADVLESTELRAMYELVDDQDFSDEPPTPSSVALVTDASTGCPPLFSTRAGLRRRC